MRARRLLKVEEYPLGAIAIGTPRPALPVSAWCEDFSLLVRSPRRLRLKRGTIRVLS